MMLRALSAAVLAAGLSAPGPLHPGPPVHIEVDIGPETVDFVFTGEQYSLLHWLGLPVPEGADRPHEPEELQAMPPLLPEERARIAAAVERFLASANSITIEGEERPFTVTDIAIPSDSVTRYGLPALTFTLRYAVDAPPRRIGIVWETWERLLYFDKTQLPVLFRVFDQSTLVFLTPEEPGFVWHAESVVPRERPDVVEVVAPPPESLSLPLWSLGGLGLALFLVPFARRLGGRVVLVGASVAAATAIVLLPVRTEVPNWFRPDVEVPSEGEALELFATLHRNVYEAFEGRTEQEIYDLLAVSVAPWLLDELYGEIYESLIMRREGGAVCEIEKLDVRQREARLDEGIEPWDRVDERFEDAPAFTVLWEWDVHGVVSHWGHVHRRTNRYAAEYKVLHDGRSWKIAAWEVLEHSREDRDG